MKKIAIILSGCGVYDGAEIHESVLTMLHIEQLGASYECFAPNVQQHHVINHLTGEEQAQQRNVLEEAARIARGNIKDLSALNANEFDALVIPGGFGVAKNLSSFAFDGAQATILESLKHCCQSFTQQHKPIAYLCIAPTLIGHIHPKGTLATIGNDEQTAAATEQLGAKHVSCDVDDIVVDEQHKVISTPAYMLANSITQASSGIQKALQALLDMS
ncbi:isoprenoid biosynthesis glyoxalase ElbB [Pseudoalteromonas sp. T1lg23B]|uniref:isoprenoid biosynthesis glyoxalase ElbB n=1 Tax=Pseudoalteromonas sp. T1lg23B TaxID=2077097 RepID=UPI000CF6B368|nr:isoprenoid biosynthesis glyoxalase ElbB [Pseudoalteromonas sp. T1lg23B]